MLQLSPAWNRLRPRSHRQCTGPDTALCTLSLPPSSLWANLVSLLSYRQPDHYVLLVLSRLGSNSYSFLTTNIRPGNTLVPSTASIKHNSPVAIEIYRYSFGTNVKTITPVNMYSHHYPTITNKNIIQLPQKSQNWTKVVEHGSCASNSRGPSTTIHTYPRSFRVLS